MHVSKVNKSYERNIGIPLDLFNNLDRKTLCHSAIFLHWKDYCHQVKQCNIWSNPFRSPIQLKWVLCPISLSYMISWASKEKTSPFVSCVTETHNLFLKRTQGRPGSLKTHSGTLVEMLHSVLSVCLSNQIWWDLFYSYTHSCNFMDSH